MVTAKTWWDDGAGPDDTERDLTAVVDRGSVKSGNDNGWLQVNNKILKWFG